MKYHKMTKDSETSKKKLNKQKTQKKEVNLSNITRWKFE